MNLIRRTVVVVLALAVSGAQSESIFNSEILSYVNVLTCAVNAQPWDCVYQRSGKMLDSIQDALVRKEAELKAQADAAFTAQLAARGFSESEVPEKDKPSTIITTMENYVTDGVKELMFRAYGDSRKEKGKKKKKPTVELVQYEKPEIYELVEAAETGHDVGHKHGHKIGGHGGHGGHIFGGHGGGLHFKKKHGRSIGVKRGKGKKKKRKALMKLLLIGAVLKAKVELLLKVIATHLQLKFFVVAVIGLLVNIARFWVDLKRGQQPQKVVYYEHAHHQHVYDEHDDGWGGSGSYWKRSLNAGTESPDLASAPVQLSANYDRIGSAPPPTINFNPSNYRTYDEHLNVYNGGGSSSSGGGIPQSQPPTYADAQSIVYSKQMPPQTYSFN